MSKNGDKKICIYKTSKIDFISTEEYQAFCRHRKAFGYVREQED